MNRIFFPILACVTLLGCSDASDGLVSPAEPNFAASTTTESTSVPIDMPVFISCAAGGAGETVLLSGNLHILTHTTIDATGGFHTKYHFQPQGVSGVGMTTGTMYRGTGVSQGTVNGKVGLQETIVNNFRVIGQGRGNNLLIHSVFHITVNANGEVTATVDKFSEVCK